MSKVKGIQGIIFDMDNTLLQSHIQFKAMKEEVAELLMQQGYLGASFSMENHTTSTLLAYAQKEGAPPNLIEAALQIAQKHELRGMEGAGLEPEALELLDVLKGHFKLVIVTNNSEAAALQALEITGIKNYFDLIVGREQMDAMKPAPSGYLVAMRYFPEVPAKSWLSVGDSWIDGQASMDAYIPFISYGQTTYAMEEKGVQPFAHIDKLLSLLDYV
ncbi:HAD hydrolase-like protein [Paenibacillus alba]|uniref:HAD family hydrolase n=1 Tax=Paenibacillus alba TaxID=1197127 RepID=UPI00156555E6|nr:HAD hydrolase-like protein [Paenibacillus alba]NQX65078.1 HAD hydrolase-like protein [Paenibacillus alba]